MALTKLANKELLECPDCIALSETGKCKWLGIIQCKGKECTFQKTEEDICQEKKHVLKRIAELEERKQVRIAQRYYRGNRPWNEEEEKQ